MLDIGQEITFDKILIQASLCEPILKLRVSDGMGDAKNSGTMYKTINNQIVVVELLIRNDPFIIVVNCKSHRGAQCFKVPEMTSFSGISSVPNGCCGSMLRQVAPKTWVSNSWVPVCEDTIGEYTTNGNHITTITVNEETRKIHHSGRSANWCCSNCACLCCMALFPPLCPTVCCMWCTQRGVYYDIVEKDIWVTFSFVHVTLKNASCLSASACDFTLGGLFPAIEKQELEARNPVLAGKMDR